MELQINGKRCRTDALKQIGKGGEADIFDLGGGKVLKLFKPPGHTDYDGDVHEQKGAAERIRLHQIKLKQFPRGLPAHVVAPEELALDSKGMVAGYAMRAVKGADLLMRFSEKSFRIGNVPNGRVVSIFQNLHATVAGIHQAKVVIGDFNDLNGLVVGTDVFIIDADSFQFDPFFCMTFTQKFVDPLLCDPQASSPMLVRPHNPNSDWYAFGIMLMQSLLYVGPYGGVYKPKNSRNRIPHDARSLHRVTVFDPDVVYPKPAIHWSVLTDELLHFFHEVFKNDRRDRFPLDLLQGLEWRTCRKCGLEFARQGCPICEPQLGGVVKEKVVITTKGKVTMTSILQSSGVILYATFQGGKLCYVVHENGQFKRETGEVVYRGELEQGMRCRIHGGQTLIGKQNQFASLESGTIKYRKAVDSNGANPLFDANESHVYWAHGGQLVHDGEFGSHDYIGDILEGQTQFWVGPTFGFGFYWAGMIRVGFVFDANKRGINDTVKLPPMRGQLVDTRCFLSKDRAWFLWMRQAGGVRMNHCISIKKDGTVTGHAQATEGDGSWLGTIGAKCAFGDILFAATDEGVVQVKVEGGVIAEKQRFPDTEPFVDTECSLLVGSDGLYVITRSEITRLTIQR
jgi:H/ACA ribonucleoprotein complex subunit 3